MKTEHRKAGIGTGLIVTGVVVVVLIVAAGYFIFFPSTNNSSTTTTTSTSSTTSTSTSTITTNTSTTPTTSSTTTSTTSTITTPSTSSSTTSTTSTNSTTTTPSTSSSTTSTTTSTTATGSTVQIIIPAGIAANLTANFEPSTISVAPGTTIVFVNKDTTNIHNVHFMTMPSGATFATNPSPNTNLWTNNMFSVTLTVAGTYTYVCDYHSWMTGTITVT